MISVEQCRAARALLDWSAQKLADEAAVGVATVRRFEGGQIVADTSLEAMKAALSCGGVIFIDHGKKAPAGGDGVRLVRSATAGD